jgi:hypothetical protein
VNIPCLYDAGALIAIDNNDRRMWARHHLALDDGRDIRIPAVVVTTSSSRTSPSPSPPPRPPTARRRGTGRGALCSCSA